MPKPLSVGSVLVIGSGPIVIGQACEFDYAGAQAIRALKAEGLEVVLINSNPATIMTDPSLADHVYLWPLTTDSIARLLALHSIDAVLPTMGGQTALNLAMECHKIGLWARYEVRWLGTTPEGIQLTEDRAAFSGLMERLGVRTCRGEAVDSYLAGKEAAQHIGFPLIIRSSYTLGGTGGNVVRAEEDLEAALAAGLKASPIHEVLVEESVWGWLEFELEVMRDKVGQFAVIAVVENIDPVGIHTGDSITIAPALTLPDTVYQRMRDIARRVLDALAPFSGGCNIQFAMHPDTEDLIVIEVNPRVSRSSALASKATGYPIARVATQLALGYHLDELPNPITCNTSALFEPSLDYVALKIPRWNFNKFPEADTTLGLQMKSVGEVMAIGQTFQEALQKAIYSLEIDLQSTYFRLPTHWNEQELGQKLRQASWDRLFCLIHALRLGLSIASLHDMTAIHPWFLHQLADIAQLTDTLSKKTLATLSPTLLRTAKQKGFGDEHLAFLMNTTPKAVAALRIKLNLNHRYACVDTCAAEFKAQTPYYYSTMHAKNESKPTAHNKKVLVIGAGPNRIGQGIEFDYCCVHGAQTARECGYEALMMNCNPETVSTDFDVSNRLYFDPLHPEYVDALIAHEKPMGVITQLGGQTALKLAKHLHAMGVPILGTPFEAMDCAEDRGKFSDLLKKNQIPYPQYGIVNTVEEAFDLANQIGFPLLVRPSYVLGGEHMKIVLNPKELEAHLMQLFRKGIPHRILLDQFLEHAIEAEADAMADGHQVRIIGIMQHLEPAGIHSGDSCAVLPPFDLKPSVLKQIQQHTHTIAKKLKVVGLINIQFAIQNDKVYVIEANPRASRTVPFICKAHKVAYVQQATQIILGHTAVQKLPMPKKMNGLAIKEPTFSFHKFPGVNKALGPEMKSTGEQIYFVKDTQDPYFRRLYEERNWHLSR